MITSAELTAVCVEQFDFNELRILFTGWTGKRWSISQVKQLYSQPTTYCYQQVGDRKMIAEGVNRLDAASNCLLLAELKIPKGKGEWI